MVTDSYDNPLAMSVKLYGIKDFLKEYTKNNPKTWVKAFCKIYRCRIGLPTGSYGVPEEMGQVYLAELLKDL